MYGFIGRISKYGQDDLICMPHNTEKCITNKIQHNDFLLKQCTLDKFGKDKIFYESNEYIIALEGVIYNYNSLSDKYGILNRGKLLEYLYKENGIKELCNLLDGYFSGIIYNKGGKIIELITDHIGYRPVWYFKNDEHFIFSTDIDWLYKSIKASTGYVHFNMDGFTCLLNYGYMLGDVTLVDNVRKLLPGHYLRIRQDKTIELNEYYSIPKPNDSIAVSTEEILSKIDYELSASVKKAYEKDEEYSYEHIATISGGLDSRIMLFKACQLGYQTTCLTMGEAGCADINISSQICNDLKQEHLIYELNNGLYLSDVDSAIIANGGNIMWPGFAHGYEMRKMVSLNRFGAIHSGDCGDVILGGSYYEGKEKVLIKETFDIKKDVLAYGKSFGGSFSEEFEKREKERYVNKVLFNYYNRGVNSAGNGVYGSQFYSEGSSPFMSKGLLNLMFSLPYEMTKDHKIYIEYMKKFIPQSCNYIWDNTGCKPGSGSFSRWIVRWKRRIRYRVFHKYSSMNPYDKWYENNEKFRLYLNQIYRELDELQSVPPELEKMIIEKYSSTHALDKTLACVAIATVKKYELEM